MEKNVYHPPGSPARRTWTELHFARAGALLSFPLFIASSSVSSELVSTGLLIAGGLCFAAGLVLAASFVCPRCERPFMRLRIVDYFLSIWLFKILMVPSCIHCKATSRTSLGQ